MSTIRSVVAAALRATMLGVGTIFQPKARDDDHWSVSPVVEIVHEIEDERPGDPPVPGLDRLPKTA